ncbi:hypothetical protein FZC78_10695 [Rossellomorea vietnamensis]|uniref:Uncharacterized protein n=1 Tax=Rossellomorea vietnamensis TaxID=218284 RepID=A0A5D4NT80_9BACI|nr:hypothetical protein [Rossellomorea vietnamensis]TYS17079.1 hypothetical protein FZC78_10695 [Rossellomorea vietnamensis]
MLIKPIKDLFAKWEMNYSTHDFAEYSAMKGRLENNSIPYKMKTVSPGIEKGEAASYQLFVSKALMKKANEAIHNKDS